MVSQEISLLGNYVKFQTPNRFTVDRYSDSGSITSWPEDVLEINLCKILAWAECHKVIEGNREIEFLLNYLKGKKWIECKDRASFRVTVEGYERLSIINQAISDSSQAFVAMWFDKSMDSCL